ncbi:hypothetical protein QNI19_07760 [Cytophagaceae bacterium DM2B3-1]|uniref:DUF748 domain-containing protein n=1 Tax=Xanthocytophaga flava TaxID=3048013 RepID=A0ABT7CGF4_9BACT|nr:hypothetical protein [Xanthocytophaga flavus]MDJ1492824.1 hypothetical protein [Xanthocytophaga flavus]
MKTSLVRFSSSRTGKVLKWVGGIIAVVIVGIFIWLNVGLGPTIRKKLEAKVSEATKGKYQLKINWISINFITSNLVFHNVSLQPGKLASYTKGDSSKRNTNLGIEAKSVQLHDIKWRTYLAEKKIELKGIYINSPDITITQTKPDDIKQIDSTDQKKSLEDLLNGLKNEIQIDEIIVKDGKLKHTVVAAKGKSTQSAEHIRIALHNIRLDSVTKQKRSFPFLDKIEASLENYQFVGADNLYALKVGKVDLKDDHSLAIENMKLQPTVSDKEFVRRKKVQNDRFIITVPKIECKGVELRQALDKKLIAQSVRVNNPVVNIYRDKRMPPKPNHHPLMPNEAVRNINFQVQIDSTFISGASITYAEQVLNAPKPGKVMFEKSNVRITNLSNDPKRMTDRNPVKIHATTMLMQGGLLTLNVSMNLLSKQFNCAYRGHLDRMSATAFNLISFPNENIRLTDGLVNEVTFSSHIRRGIARGSVKALYRDLKIEVIDPEKHKTHQLLTLLGNIAIKADNTAKEEKPARLGTIFYQRERDDSFVTYLWQSLKSGLFSSITTVNINKVKEIRKKAKALQKKGPRPTVKEKKDSVDKDSIDKDSSKKVAPEPKDSANKDLTKN